MRRTLTVLLSAALMSVALPPAAQAANDGAIVGRFVDEYGLAVNDLTVQLWGGNGATTKTTSTGNFTLSPVTTDFAITFDWYDQGPYFEFSTQTWYGGGTDPDTAPTFLIPPGTTKDVGTIVLRSTQNPGISATAINTADKKSVRSAFRKQLRPTVIRERVLRPHGCNVAKTPVKAQKRTIRAVNFMRALSGVDPVVLDKNLSKMAQKSALIQHYQGGLNHYPGPSARCYTADGAQASASSNLAMGYVAAKAVLGYMVDPGANNLAAGHRRWIVDPYAEAMGTGDVGRFNALYVYGPQSQDNPTPQYLSWPTAGFFPHELEPGGRWSFSATRYGDFSFDAAKVQVTVGGKSLRLKQHQPQAGAGDQTTLVWNLAKRIKVGKKARTAVVTISGMTQRGIALAPYSYSVSLFRAGR